MFAKVPKYSVITPHKYEFDRLFGASETMYQRLIKAKQIAVEREITIVLKGANTAVVKPSGEIYFNSTGNPGMATAGSGDVLTGIITGLMGYHFEDLTKTVAVSAYINGFAGDLAAQMYGEIGMTSADTAKNIALAIKTIINM
jgi:NAD(P)H-hydrate epimerase